MMKDIEYESGSQARPHCIACHDTQEVKVDCHECNGRGRVDKYCLECHGRKSGCSFCIANPHPHYGKGYVLLRCAHCDGTGKIDHPCECYFQRDTQAHHDGSSQ